MLCISNSCYQYGLSHGKTWPCHVYNSIKREVCQNVTAISTPFGSYLGTGCLTHRIKLFYSSHQQHSSSRILTFANKYLRQSGAIEFGISCNTSFCRFSWMTNPMVTIFWRLNHPPPPCAAYMPQWIGSALVQIMACRIFGTKLLSKPLMGCCQLDP